MGHLDFIEVSVAATTKEELHHLTFVAFLSFSNIFTEEVEEARQNDMQY